MRAPLNTRLPLGVRRIYELQARPPTCRKLPWNLSLSHCRSLFEAGHDLDDSAQNIGAQPTFTSLPSSLRKPIQKHWFPPVFHFGFVFDEQKLKQLQLDNVATHAGTGADMIWSTTMAIHKIMYTGYMQVSPAVCSDSTEELVSMLSIATNYNPWVEPARMEKIEKLLGGVLGQPKWMVESEFAFWKKGPHMDSDLPFTYFAVPYKWYIGWMSPEKQERLMQLDPST